MIWIGGLLAVRAKPGAEFGDPSCFGNIAWASSMSASCGCERSRRVARFRLKSSPAPKFSITAADRYRPAPVQLGCVLRRCVVTVDRVTAHPAAGGDRCPGRSTTDNVRGTISTKWIVPERVATASRPRSREYARPVGPGPAQVERALQGKASQRSARLGLKQLQNRVTVPGANQVIDVVRSDRFTPTAFTCVPARGDRIAMPSDCDATGIMIQSESGEYET